MCGCEGWEDVCVVGGWVGVRIWRMCVWCEGWEEVCVVGGCHGTLLRQFCIHGY